MWSWRWVILLMFIGPWAGGCDSKSAERPTCEEDSQCGESKICRNSRCGSGVRPVGLITFSDAENRVVPVSVEVLVAFSEAMATKVTEAAFGVLKGEHSVPGEFTWAPGDLELRFVPTENLDYGSYYRVVIGATAESLKGVPTGDEQVVDFQTEASPFTVLSHSLDGEEGGTGLLPLISVLTSEPITEESLADSVRVARSLDGSPVDSLVYVGPSKERLFIYPRAPLEGATEYELILEPGAMSEHGNPLSAGLVVTFRTGEFSALEAPEISIGAAPELVTTNSLVEGGYSFRGEAGPREELEWVGVQVGSAGEAPTGRWLEADLVDTAWSFNWDPTLLPSHAEGELEVWVMATNRMGASVTVMTPVRVDVTPAAAPEPVEELPDTWKFRRWEPEFRVEEGAQLQVEFDGVLLEEAALLVEGDRVKLTLELPDQDRSYQLVVKASDSVGNWGGEELVHQVSRIGYTCLSAENGFPPPGITLRSSSDDELGNVVVVYELADGFVEDTYISATSGAEKNHGIEQQLGVGQGPDFRTLIRVPEGVLPSCGTLGFARLSYRAQEVCEGCPGLRSFEAFLVGREWREREVTWNNASQNTPWSEPGVGGEADRGEDPIGVLAEGEEENLLSLELTEAVRLWRASVSEEGGGVLNRGIILLPTEDGSRMLYASEHIDPGLRPTLELHLVEGI